MEKFDLAVKVVAKTICDDRCVCNDIGGGKCRHDYEYEAKRAISAVSRLVKEGKLDLSKVPAIDE